MKKIPLALLVALTSFTLTHTTLATYKYPSAYWKYHEPYNNAVAAKDTNEIVRLGKDIVNLLANEPYESVIPNLVNIYRNLYEIYQTNEDYDNALVYLKEYIKGAEFLGWDDAVKLGKAKLNHLDLNINVYAETTNIKVPFYNSMNEPKNGTYVGRIYNSSIEKATKPTDNESIISFYSLFGKEKFSEFDWFIRQYDKSDKVLHFAWNLSEENSGLNTVLSSNSDAHIIETLKYINSFESPTMLRIFAEMNVWQDLADPQTFKEAYIKVANLARTYAPKTALVFSPNVISNWNVDIDDYYPGDEFVDWVGVSLYTALYSNPDNPVALEDFNESYYFNGIYSNPIVQLKDIVERYGSKKPIIITEGAGGHKIKNSNLDLTPFAKKYINQLYSYIGMVYPEVKASIYFDVDLSFEKYDFALFNNENLSKEFFNTISNNSSFNTGLESSTKAYTKLENFNQITDELSISTYAVFPSEKETEVKVYLDNELYNTSNVIPYTTKINTKNLSTGVHPLKVVVTNGNYNKELFYNLTKTDSGLIYFKDDLILNGDNYSSNNIIQHLLSIIYTTTFKIIK